MSLGNRISGGVVQKPRRSPFAKILDAPGLPSGKVLKHEITREYYEVGDDVVILWQLLDGSRTVSELVETMHEKDEEVDEEYVRETLNFMAGEGFIEGTEPAQQTKKIRVESAFEVDVVIIPNSIEAFRTWLRYLSPLLNKYSLVASLVFIAIGLLLFSNQFSPILAQRRNFEVLGSTVIGFLFYFFAILHPVTWLHEYAHGTALTKYGGEPGEVGVGLFYFGPMFYVDTSDSIRLRTKERIMVSLAGPLVNLIFGSAFALASLYYPSHILRMGAFFSFYFSLFWFLPLIENDGYYAYADLVGNPNIRQDALRYIKSKLGLASGDEEIEKLSWLEKFNLLAYGLMVIVFVGFLIFVSSIYVFYMVDDVIESLYVIGFAILGRSASLTVIAFSIAILIIFSMYAVGFAAFLVKGRRRRAQPQ